jgi:hypothetical protein
VLSVLSALEQRGQLAELREVSFVDGASAASADDAGPLVPVPGAGDTAGPGAGAGAGGPGGSEVSSVVEVGPDDVETRRLRMTCQIVHVERVGPGTMIDLAALGTGRMGAMPVPAGSVLALGFGPEPPGASCQDLQAVMGYWEALGVVVDLEVAETATVTRYRFSCPDDGLAVLVETDLVEADRP